MIPKTFLLFFTFMLLAGCAHIQECAKEVWGSSMRHLEKARAQARIVMAPGTKHDVFEQSVGVLAAKGGNVYLKDKNENSLAAMNFTGYVDTTQVGLFFTPQDDGMTKIEVASLSPWLAEDVAEFLSSHFGVTAPSASDADQDVMSTEE